MNETWLVENKYEIISKIKQGGFGVVYYGFDQTFQRPVAIKAVEPGLLNEARYVDMFLEEAKNAAKLNHNNIVHVYDLVKKDEGQYYIIMEYINGVDLGRLIRIAKEKNVRIPANIGIFIIKEICKALEYAHNKRDLITNQHLNLVHQDISPSNIMVSFDGHVKLIDFGIAKLKFYKNKKSKDKTYVGKLPYLSPEQLNGGIVNKLTDLFSLGSVFYEVMIGERLFNQETNDDIIESIRKAKIDTKTLEKGEIPEEIIQVLTKMLQKDPGSRYQGANGIYLDLVEYLMENVRTVELSNEFADFIHKNFPDLLKESSVNAGRRSTIYARSDEISGDEMLSSVIEDDDISNVETVDKIDSDEKSSEVGDEDQNRNESDSNGDLKKDNGTKDNSLIDDIALDEFDKLNIDKQVIEKEDGSNGDTKEDELNESELKKIKSVLEEEIKPSFEYKDIDDTVVDEKESNQKNNTAIEMTSTFKPKTMMPEDYSQVEDDEKTVIDVIRLSAKARRRPILFVTGGLLMTFIILMALNIYFQWTDYGARIYDRIFPPAIKIYSSPQGARVYLDGEELGSATPLTIHKIVPGVHQLKLTYAGYPELIRSIMVPSSGMIKVDGEKSRKGYEPYLFRFKSQIELQSDPIGAVVMVNGVELKQKTPSSIEWEVGIPLSISMKLNQFNKLDNITLDLENDKVQIEDNRLWNVQRVSDDHSRYLIEGYFKKFIKVSSVPNDALIYLDDFEEPVGKTGSMNTIPLSMGSHEILFVKDGYNSKRINLRVSEDGPKSIYTALTRNVRFFAKDITDPEDNEIGAIITSISRKGKTRYFDYQTPCEVPLEPYNYKATLKKNGYKETTVFVSPAAREVIVRMEPVNANLEVFVIDALTGLPLSDAHVSFRGIDETSAHEIIFGVSNDFGRCKNNINPGDYVFRVKREGYFEKSTTFNTNDGKRLEFKLVIQ